MLSSPNGRVASTTFSFSTPSHPLTVPSPTRITVRTSPIFAVSERRDTAFAFSVRFNNSVRPESQHQFACTATIFICDEVYLGCVTNDGLRAMRKSFYYFRRSRACFAAPFEHDKSVRWVCRRRGWRKNPPFACPNPRPRTLTACTRIYINPTHYYYYYSL